MIEWIAIGILVLIGLFVLQVEHHTRKYKILALILVGLLIYFSIVGIFSSQEADLTSPKGIVSAVYLYVGWIGETSSKLWDIGTDTASLVGNAIKVNDTSQEKPKK